MSAIIPTIGRIVLYCLSITDVRQIMAYRHANSDFSSPSVAEGDVFPAMVTKVHGPDMINVKVMLDGHDTFWATSRSVSEDPAPGYFHWMPYQKQVAATAAATAEAPAPEPVKVTVQAEDPVKAD